MTSRTRNGRAVALAGTLLLALTGCGSAVGEGSSGAEQAASSTSTSAASSTPLTWHGCTADEARSTGRLVGPVRLGGGTASVRFAGRSGPCGGGLLAVDDRGVRGVAVADLGLDAASARVVQLRGPDTPELLLVDERPTARGGVQSHLFAGTTDGLVELTVRDGPLLPFFATDGGATPIAATCTDDGGLAVTTASTHQPPGVVLAWDLHRATYAVTDGRARRTSSVLVDEAVADPLLRRDRPQLFSGDYLADCTRSA